MIPVVLNLFDTELIPNFPKNVVTGWMSAAPAESLKTISGQPLLSKFLDTNALQSFQNDRRKAEHILSRLLLLGLCGKKGWDLNQIELKKTELGKPYLEVGGAHKSVTFSHSTELILCAISDDIEIGIDAEPSDRKVKPELLTRILGEEESKELAGETHIGLWTLKEAAVKCLGTGIRMGLKSIRIQKLENGFFSITAPESPEMHAVSFEQQGHHISLAWVSR